MTDDHSHRGDDVHSVEAEAAEANGGWHPIETAPTNYTNIIGIDRNGCVAKTWFFAPSSYTRNWMRCGFGKQKPWNPVGWMPLPAAPTETP